MAKVNLDALIPREDFEVQEIINSGKKKETLSIEDIKHDSFFFSNLRKPDFQRETNEWDAKKITELIKSFISGDLIPAIILWRSTGGYIFVIDGSHRLSALIAWVNNDYGDGEISKLFYDGIIPEEQLEIAKQTRSIIEKSIGNYSDYRLALTHPDKVKSEIVRNAKNLGALAIQLQWVEGDARKAENSFFKINQQASPIDQTEIKLLKYRKKPQSIAARAIIRSGKGHKYWSLFPEEAQKEIQEIAAEINTTLFTPKLKNPIKTLDLPIAGKLYSAQTLPLIVDMIGIVCGTNDDTPDDQNGHGTIDILKQIRRISRIINSMHPSSLGLHPAVYFYSQEGRHKSSSFLATLDFICKLKNKDEFKDFINIRSKFEKFIINNDYLIQQINRKYRIGQKSYIHISNFLQLIKSCLLEGKDSHEIIDYIKSSDKFDYLTFHKFENSRSDNPKFNTEQKSAIYLREVIEKAPRCAICDSYLHANSITIDHIERKREGGLARLSNGQLAHPYCNTTFKN